jgi:ABC-type multidrug transport system fused ATPase/permease subunit
MFGTPRRKLLHEKNLYTNQFFLNFLEASALKEPLVKLGADLALQAVETFGDLAPSTVLAQRCPIAPQKMGDCKIIVKRLKKDGVAALEADNRQTLLKLALRYRPGQHKLVKLSQDFKKMILKGRQRFRDMISSDDPNAVSFYNTSAYIDHLTILSNIFFGNITTDSSRGQEKINQSINQLLIEEEILETILEMGMQHQVGRSGENLSGGQRQKLAIARVLLKEPTVLIMDEATSGLDNKSQARIQNLLETQMKGKTTLLSVVHRLDIIKDYHKVAVMRAGKIVEMGTYDELMDKQGILYELVTGKR